MFIVEDKAVAQGDILIRKIDKLPADAIKLEAENGNYVVAHSETGHHHAVKAVPQVSFYQNANDNNIAYLVIDNAGEDVELKHLRSFDTHESIGFRNGIHEIRRQVEGGVRGFVRVAD